MRQWNKLFPWRVQVLIAATAAMAGLFVLQSVLHLEPLGAKQVIAVVVFGALAATAHFWRSWLLNQQANYSTVVATLFALCIVLPRNWVAPVTILSWLPWIVLKQRTKPTWPVEALFNVSQAVLSALAGRTTFDRLIRLSPSPTVAVLAAALVFLIVETGLVSAIVMFYKQIPLWQADTLKPRFLSTELLTLIVGAVSALLYLLDPLSLALIFLPLGYLQYLLEKLQDEKAAYVDAKTGLYNYKYIDERLPRELALAQETGVPLSIVFSDLDFLREINNNHGHLAGDIAIRHVGAILTKCTHDNHFVARFGGEEYVMVLPQVDHDQALHIAEQARALLAESPIAVGDSTLTITGSFGVASAPGDATTVRDLIHAADSAVYAAKAAGRNCVRSCRQSPPLGEGASG